MLSLLRNFHVFENLFMSSSSPNLFISSSISSASMNVWQQVISFFHTATTDPLWWHWPLIVYGSIEISFYLIFHFHLIPRANQRTPPQPFRAFGCSDGKDRFALMRKILDRLERTCSATGEDMFQATAHYLSNWFRFEPEKAPLKEHRNHPRPPPMRRVSNIMTDTDSSRCTSHGEDDESEDGEWEPIVENNAKGKILALPHSRILRDATATGDSVELMWNDGRKDGCEKSNIFKWAMHTLRYDDVNDLLACFFFGKRVEELEAWETIELKKLFDYLEEHFDLRCQPGRSMVCSPRLLTLEDVDPWHRPLAVYAGIYAFTLGKAGCLWAMGFRHYVTKTGLQYWHRPAPSTSDDLKEQATIPNPLLFFHGIAPGGSAIYIPMLLAGVANDGRALFIFENQPVSSHPNFSFEVLNEDETIEGVQEALERFHPEGDIALMGHSFGSFQLTWLIYSPLRDRIRQFALLDPVSILLSEPDLIMNFENATPLFKIFLKDLWTNFYIRRHFSWYRSELWLDDLPDNVDFFVGVAEKDQIINGPKVKREVEIFGDEHPAFARQTTVAFWPKALHGECLYKPSKWTDVRNFFEMTKERDSLRLQKQKVR